MRNNEYQTHFEAYLLTEKRVSKNTFDAYKRDIEQLMSYLETQKLEIDQLQEIDIKNFLKHLHDYGIKSRSSARKISSLKQFFNFLHRRYDFADLGIHLHIPKIEKKLPEYLTEQEIEQLFEVASRDITPQGIRDKIMLCMLYVSGMRVSELVELTTASIAFDTGLITIRGKGGRERLVPLPVKMLQSLAEYIQVTLPIICQGMQTNYLFPVLYGKTLKPMSRQGLWLTLKKIWSQTGIQRSLSPHKLRHSFATHLLKQGAHLRSLQMLLGHENLNTVQIYTHLEKSYVRTVYDKKHPRS